MEIIAFLRRHLSYISQPLNLLGEDHSPPPPKLLLLLLPSTVISCLASPTMITPSPWLHTNITNLYIYFPSFSIQILQEYTL